MPRKRLSGQERRVRIMEAALEIFAQKGYNGARTKQIARRAGISETLIYQHFVSKTDLYHQSMEHMFSQHPVWGDVEQSMAQEDDHGVFFNFARHVITHGRKDPRIVRLVAFMGLEDVRPPAGHRFDNNHVRQEQPEMILANYIAMRINKGAFRPIDPKVAAKLYLYQIFQSVADYHLRLTSDPIALSDDDLAETLADLFLHGVKS